MTDTAARRRLLFVALACASLLGLCQSAGAATTFGSTFSVAPEKSLCGTATFTNTALAGGVGAPFAGAIVRWRMDLHEGGGAFKYRLRVLRPDGGTSYTSVASGPLQTAPLAGVNVLTLPAPLPVQAGDIIAIDCPEHAPIPSTNKGLAGSTFAFFVPDLGEGVATMTTNQLPGEEMLINADVVGLPTVATFSPTSGPTAGGTVVSVTGTHLGEVSAVSFGGVAATFTLVSETQLFAVAPASASGGPVTVSVVDAAGSAAPQTFTYVAPPVPEAGTGTGTGTSSSAPPSVGRSAGGGGPAPVGNCVAPKLAGKKLPAAKKALTKADCKLGKVSKRKGATAKTGLVVSQSPQTGKVLAAGAKVAVKLAPPAGGAK